jgi:nicotinate-nucleotide adenylyltransferase
MRVAMLGGVFDPVHNAHLQIARQAQREYRLQKIIFVPTSRPPHKPAPEASAEQRLAMLRLALADFPALGVSTCELQRAGVSYTIDTLRELKPDYLICGEDAFQAFNTWHEPAGIRALVELIIVPRVNRISSTIIRNSVKQGKPIRDLVPPAVATYIQKNSLYAPLKRAD